MPTPTTHQSDLPLGGSFIYKSTMRVTIFGRERNEYGVVEYYWVKDGSGKRFKAWPKELRV